MNYLIGAIFFLFTLGLSLAHPATPPPTQCDISDDVQTLCQRCAKVTKSKIVYPMCCTDAEEAKTWCFHYVTFGIQGPK